MGGRPRLLNVRGPAAAARRWRRRAGLEPDVRHSAGLRASRVRPARAARPLGTRGAERERRQQTGLRRRSHVLESRSRPRSG
eukprot:7624188-Lingulodinium_polyedra.AAC.1